MRQKQNTIWKKHKNVSHESQYWKSFELQKPEQEMSQISRTYMYIYVPQLYSTTNTADNTRQGYFG